MRLEVINPCSIHFGEKSSNKIVGISAVGPQCPIDRLRQNHKPYGLSQDALLIFVKLEKNISVTNLMVYKNSRDKHVIRVL